MRRVLAAIAATLLAGCTTVDAHAITDASAHPEARAYDVSGNAMADVDAALTRAAADGKHVIVALGANWCHDSRAFAGWLETPRFRALTDRAFEVVYVNVGMPQTGDAHHMDVARRFGFETLEGTPTVLVLDAQGTVLNPDTAKSWRNAASRSADAIHAELERLAPPES